MNQRLAYTLCFVGMVFGCYFVNEIIGDAQTWDALTTPQAVAHMARILGSFGVAIAGALGVDLSKFPIILNLKGPN